MNSKQAPRQVGTGLEGEARPDPMAVNLPEIVIEVEAVFARYEAALVNNDVEILDELFWNDERTIRFGIAENLFGYETIAAFRAARPSSGADRALSKTVVTTFGQDFATVSTLFTRASTPAGVGRQMQTWARTADGWRVVAAHVSVIAIPG